MPEWAKRFAGDEGPKLSITGRRKIIFEGRSTWVVNDNSTSGQGSSLFPALKMNQESDFTVRGKVGRLIDVSITQNSDMEELGQQLKDQVKIHYKGEGDELEDEIIQEIEAGNTQMALPNTEFSGYTESHKGLFGIRLRAKVGDLDITAVASQEKGESQRAEFVVGQAKSETFPVSDNQYSQNYFFLDTAFARFYRSSTEPPLDYKVRECMVFIHRANNMFRQTEELQFRPRSAEIDGEKRNFQLLQENQDYMLDRIRGFIAVNGSVMLNPADAIGIYYKLESRAGVGDTTGFGRITSDDSLPVLDLKIIKKPNQRPSDPTWTLMWKNVYSVGMVERADAKDMKVEIVLNRLNDTLNHQDGTLFTALLGLADSTGTRLRIDNDSIFQFERGEIIFPVHNGIQEPFADSTVLDSINPLIYNYTIDNEIRSLYTIRVSAVTSRNDYNLGMNVIPNTERVKLGGQTLERNVDYTIDYESGSLVITTPNATQGARIEVDYESESIFMAEQKVFLGTRLEYKLPWISKESFVGLSALYKSESISEQYAQIGREPYRKILLDANTKLIFNPAWMTKAVDALPLVETEQASRLEFSAEVAHSRPNPNLKGEAMVDDFEGADLSYPLGLIWTDWKTASPLGPMRPDTLVPGASWWYNPRNKVPQDSIWHVETTARDRLIDVLNLEVRPANASGNSWGAIMRALMPGTRDQSKTRFFEITARSSAGGKLVIDMGKISEDLSLNGGPPNGRLDTEDKLVEGRRDGIFRPEEDVGIDGMADADEFWFRPRQDSLGQWSWDTLSLGNAALRNPRDPAGDNYDSSDVRYWQGTSGNSSIDRTPESEDLNNSGYLDLGNHYFRFVVDLSDTSSDSSYYVSGTNLNGWRLYRIPLAGAPSAAGNANWRDVDCVRLALTELADTGKTYAVQVAKAEFASNQWREASDTSASAARIELSVVNTEQNPGYQPRVPVKRAADGLLPREQSLAISYSNLSAGKSVIAKRLLSEAISLANYKMLEMDVYGHADQERDSVFFFLRLASDSVNYYEFRTLLREGWNRLQIPVADLSDLKGEYLAAHPAALRCDTFTTSGLGVAGMPQYTNCKELYAGVLTPSAAGPLAGSVWLNDLKVTSVRQEPGWAGRVSFESKLADLAAFNGFAQYEDGNFVRLGDASHIGKGTSAINGRLGGSLSLDKFLSSRWGIALPLTGSLSGSMSRPRYRPGSDVFLSDDRIGDMFGGVLNELTGQDLFRDETTPASLFQSRKMDKTLGLSYSKNNRSESRMVNLLADRVKWNYGYTNTSSAEPSRADSNRTHSGDLQYDLSPQAAGDYRPFTRLKGEHVPGFIKGLWFRPLPNRLSFTLAKATYSHQKQFDKRIMKMVVDAERLDLLHRMEMDLAPFNSFTLNYDLGVERNFDNALPAMRRGGFGEIESQVFGLDPQWREHLLLKGEVNRTQGFRASYSPSLVSWLTNQVSYNSDYRHDLSSDRKLDLTIQGASRLSVNFMPVTFLGSMGKNVKPLRLGLEKVQKALTTLSLNNIGAEYSVTTNQVIKRLKDLDLDRWQFFRFQTGFHDRSLRQIFVTGEMDDNAFGQSAYWDSVELRDHREDSRKIDRTFRGNTSIQLPYRTGVTTSLGWSRSTIVYVDPDKHRDTTEIFPEWELTVNNYELARAPGLRSKVERASITTTYRYREETRFLALGRTEVVERRFSPLFEIRLTWKNGVSGVLTHDQGRRTENNEGDGSINEGKDNRDSLSLSYRVSKQKGLRLLRWKTKLRNDLDISFGAGRRADRKTNTRGDGIAVPIADITEFNFGPGARYYFSNKIDGGIDFNYSRKLDKTRADEVTKSVLARIWAEIRF